MPLLTSLVDMLRNIVISSPLLGMLLNHFTEKAEKEKSKERDHEQFSPVL